MSRSSTYCDRGIHSLDIAFFYEYFSGFGTERFHLTFFDYFTSSQLSNLPGKSKFIQHKQLTCAINIKML